MMENEVICMLAAILNLVNISCLKKFSPFFRTILHKDTKSGESLLLTKILHESIFYDSGLHYTNFKKNARNSLFNALLIHCLLFFIPFNVYNYIYHVRLQVLFSLYGVIKLII